MIGKLPVGAAVGWLWIGCVAATGIAQTERGATPRTDDSVAKASEIAQEEVKADLSAIGELRAKSGRSLRKSESSQPSGQEPVKVRPEKEVQPTESVRAVPLPDPANEERLKFAEEYAKMANQLFERAKRAPNPAAAQVDFRDGIQKAQLSREMIRRVEASVAISVPPESPKSIVAGPVRNLDSPSKPSRQAPLRFGVSEAAAQAQQIDLRNITFDNPNLAAPQNAIQLDPNVSLITTRTGKQVDVESLIRATDRLPGNAGTNFFKTVVLPSGQEVITVDPKKLEALNDPSNQPELQRIGGVSLDVTLDLLSYLGVSEFRQRGPVRVVEDPVLISLKRLSAAASLFAESQDQWNALPDGLRFPGDIERIHGVIFDDQNEDLILVCSAATDPEHRIDIDCLIFGLRVAWRDGIVPSISLDPAPDRKGGPNYSRVEGVPIDTTFARIMLDADYTMKRIILGEDGYSVPEIRELFIKELEQTDSPVNFTKTSRYWLSPVPIGLGQLHISPTYRTLLFDSSVRCLTEEEVSAGQWLGTTNPLDEQVALLFTGMYDELEEADRFQPKGIFKRLHGLVDIVTAGKLLREMRLGSKALRDFVQLPVRELVGAEITPRSYEFLSVLVRPATESNPWDYFLCGGAVLNSQFGQRSLDSYADLTTLTLENAVDQFARTGDFSSRLDYVFALRRVADFSQGKGDLLMMKGVKATQRLDHQTAREAFEQVTQMDPFFAEAWGRLALAYWNLKEYALAKAAIKKAVELEPGDAELALLEAYLVIGAAKEGGRSAVAEKYTLADSWYLSSRITNTAWANLNRGAEAGAIRKQLDLALEIWPENGVAWYVRSLTWDDPASKQAREDRDKAISFELQEVTEGKNPQFLIQVVFYHSRVQLDALGILGTYFFDRLKTDQEALAKATDDLNEISLILDVAELDDAWSMVPPGLLSQVFAMSAAIKLDVGGSAEELELAVSEMGRALESLEEDRKEHGESAELYFSEAVVVMLCDRARRKLEFMSALTEEEARAGIRESLGKAIQMDPTYQSAYIWRSIFEASLGNRDGAMADIQVLEKLAPGRAKQVRGAVEEVLTQTKSSQPSIQTSEVQPPAVIPASSPQREETIGLLEVLKDGLRAYWNEMGQYPDSSPGSLASDLGAKGLAVIKLRKEQIDYRSQILDGWRRPLVYRRTDSGFRLYSSGPNGVDEDGAGDDIELADK